MDSTQISPLPRATSEDVALAVDGRVSSLRRANTAARRGRIKRRLTQQQVRCINNYVESHLGEVIRIDQLSALVNLSRFYFCRVFRLTFGTSPWEYLSLVRLRRAHVLLQESARSLTEIAHLCGFADQSHFTRVFLRRTGMTPGRWRQQLSVSATHDPGEGQ
jgi:AraC family transcriptional regulator